MMKNEWDLDRFTMINGALKWISASAWAAAIESWSRDRPDHARRMRKTQILHGCDVGGREIYGHGRLVTVSGRYFVDRHISAAISDSGRWPHDVDGVEGRDDNGAVAAILTTFAVLDGVVTWRVKPHSSIAAGDRVGGTALFNGTRIAFRGQVAFMFPDIIHVLQHGRFPWQEKYFE